LTAAGMVARHSFCNIPLIALILPPKSHFVEGMEGMDSFAATFHFRFFEFSLGKSPEKPSILSTTLHLF
jgi:hypothetical protein